MNGTWCTVTDVYWEFRNFSHNGFKTRNWLNDNHLLFQLCSMTWNIIYDHLTNCSAGFPHLFNIILTIILFLWCYVICFNINILLMLCTEPDESRCYSRVSAAVRSLPCSHMSWLSQYLLMTFSDSVFTSLIIVLYSQFSMVVFVTF